MIQIKPGARVTALSTEMITALIIVSSIYKDSGIDCIITSGTDGRHSRGSEHYKGDGMDFRLHNVPNHLRSDMVKTIAISLGPEYDVIWEGVNSSNEHIHVEFDPKTGVNR